MTEQTTTTNLMDKLGYLGKDALSKQALGLLGLYEEMVSNPHMVNIGSTSQLSPLFPGDRPPLALREYQIHYPLSLVEAYKIACDRYDAEFMNVVEAHKDFPTDYQYAPYTFAYQVDGPAYPEEFLDHVASVDPNVIAEFVVARAFEFENNIAAYGLNNRLWPDGTTNQTWQRALDYIRQRTGKKIAVLAGTEEKLNEMLKLELAADREHVPPEEVVRSITGFDRFMGPGDLIAHYQENGGQDSQYLYYGRTSEPKSWLKSPDGLVNDGFLSHPDILRYVRAYALTHNFDNTTLPPYHPKVITDTKEPLISIGAAFRFTDPSDIYSPEFLDYLAHEGINVSDISAGKLSSGMRNKLGVLFLKFPSENLLERHFVKHLLARGADPQLIAEGKRNIRAKPLKLHYGVYGHVIGRANRSSTLNELCSQAHWRGPYVIQPEFKNMVIADANNPDDTFIAIDRVFFVRGPNGDLEPMESCRSLMPTDSEDGKKNSVHEGPDTRCTRIVL